ncbi:MAG TPA: FtsX-like permease family protein [Streptosporangiaceae bacterium]|nr:FtsX-like permease family protein [Streptosporangiaceae bacterium]
MGRILLISRLAVRDVRRHPAQAGLVLLVIAAATATLALGLALRGVTSQPYQRTRAVTAGPDVVVSAFPDNGGSLARLMALARARGVTGHTGPYPLASPVLRAHGHAVVVAAEGRDPAPASIDQPKLMQGSWVRPGEVVVERSFADVLGVRAGDRITLDGRPFLVAGIAVTAALPFYPMESPGQVWLTRADARSLASSAQSHAPPGQPQPPDFVLNLRLADPAAARAFASVHGTPGLAMMAWQDVRDQDATLVTNSQQDLLIGSWLLGLLAVASVAVLVGGRMAEQTRRVGLIKAVGGTPGLIAAVLLAENLVLALIAAAAGLAAGWRAAPLLTSPGAGLVGAPGAPSLTTLTVALVAAAALAVALAATLVPAIRAARISTIRALADAARPPRRQAALIAAPARLPVPLLLGLRLAARRPRRAVLSAASIAITVTTIVAVLAFRQYARNAQHGYGLSGLANPQTARDSQVLLAITVALVILAAINAIFIAWATVVDARRPSALSRALGATPQQVTTGLSATQLLPALPGAILGIPLAIGLDAAVSSGQALPIPPAWQLLAVVLATLLVVAGLTAIPARIGARRPVAEILQSELA